MRLEKKRGRRAFRRVPVQGGDADLCYRLAAAGWQLGREFLTSPFGPAAAASLLLLVLSRGWAARRELPAVAFPVKDGRTDPIFMVGMRY